MSKRTEHEISIRDIMYEVLEKAWIVILIGVAVGALLFFGGYYKRLSAAQIENTYIENVELSEEEVREVEEVRLQEERAESEQEYYDNSLLLRIDPYNESRIVLQYYISENEKSHEIADALKQYAVSGALVNDVCEKGTLKYDNRYAQELIGLDDLTEACESGYVCIVVLGQNQEECTNLAELVKTEVEEEKTHWEAIYGIFSGELIAEEYSVVIDEKLIGRRNTVYNLLKTKTTQLQQLKSALSEKQLQMLEFEEGVEITEDYDQEIVVSAKWSDFVLGLIYGIILAVVLIIIAYLRRAVIYTEEELEYEYGLKKLGTLGVEDDGKKVGFHKLKKWLEDKRYNRKENGKESLETRVKELAAILKQRGVQEIYLFADSDIAYNREELQTYVKCLRENGIQTEIEEKNAFEMDKLLKYEYVIFVEQLGKTKVQDVAEKLDLCKNLKIKILGAIIVR